MVSVVWPLKYGVGMKVKCDRPELTALTVPWKVIAAVPLAPDP